MTYPSTSIQITIVPMKEVDTHGVILFTIKRYCIDTGVGAGFKVLVLDCFLHLGRRRQAPTTSDLLLIVDNPFKVFTVRMPQ